MQENPWGRAANRIILDLDTLGGMSTGMKSEDMKIGVVIKRVGLVMVGKIAAKGGLGFLVREKLPQDHVIWNQSYFEAPEVISDITREVALSEAKIRMMTVHCLGGVDMLRAAVYVAKKNAPRDQAGPKKQGLAILGIAVPPHIKDLEQAKSIAIEHAIMAAECELDGLIIEQSIFKEMADLLPRGPEWIVRGVVPEWCPENERRGVLTARDAILLGADRVIIGNPILKPPTRAADDAIEALNRTIDEIEGALKQLDPPAIEVVVEMEEDGLPEHPGPIPDTIPANLQG